MLCLAAGLIAGGCAADEATEVGSVEEELGSPSNHYFVQQYGGSFLSQSFNYVSEDGLASGNCTFGYKRPSTPTVRWNSNAGGWCGFDNWEHPADVHDCRARIMGSTGGGGFGGWCQTWVDEIRDPNEGSFSYAASATSSATANTTSGWINLSPGQTIKIGTCGVNPGSSFSGDTYIRLFNSAGTQADWSDDAAICGNLGSQINYHATTYDTFEIRAGCWSSTSCSGEVSWIIQ